MSLYDKASLVLIPSGTKTSKIYSQKPVNGDGDFTFSRSTAATRVNADGNIEKETQNLLKYSGDLTQSQWQNIRTTDVSGQAGYDGTNNAFKIIPSTDNNTHRLDYVDTWSTGQVYTFSFYAKASGYNTIDIVIGGTSIGSDYGRFNLSTGTATNSNAIAASMEDLGSGWYRCQVAQISGSTTRINIGINDGTTQIYAGDGTSGILIQDAQLEQGMVARDYIETTTAAVEGGITDNVPRLDYTDSSCPALLLEPQRRNILPHSEYIEGSFTRIDCFVGQNETTSPEGVSNASRVSAYNLSSSHLYYGAPLTAGVTYRFSGWYKGTAGEKVYIRTINQGGGAGDGKLITLTGNWQREDISITAGTGTSYVYVFDARAGGMTANNFYVYGFQLEDNGAGGGASYATSYIPTYGTSVTRNADILFEGAAGLSSFFNPTEGTLFFEVDEPLFRQLTSDGRSIAMRDTNGEYFQLRGRSNSVYFLLTMCSPNVVSIANIQNNTKYVVRWNGSEVKIFANGEARGSATQIDSFRPNTLGVASGFGMYTPTGERFTNITCFPTALSDDECIDLTTI